MPTLAQEKLLATLSPVEAKKMRRAIKNRESAQRSRKRKRERLSLLEVFTVEQDAYVSSLEARVAALERHIAGLGGDVPATPAVLPRPAALPLDSVPEKPVARKTKKEEIPPVAIPMIPASTISALSSPASPPPASCKFPRSSSATAVCCTGAPALPLNEQHRRSRVKRTVDGRSSQENKKKRRVVVSAMSHLNLAVDARTGQTFMHLGSSACGDANVKSSPGDDSSDYFATSEDSSDDLLDLLIEKGEDDWSGFNFAEAAPVATLTRSQSLVSLSGCAIAEALPYGAAFENFAF